MNVWRRSFSTTRYSVFNSKMVESSAFLWVGIPDFSAQQKNNERIGR
jgi:hypothetical protein